MQDFLAVQKALFEALGLGEIHQIFADDGFGKLVPGDGCHIVRSYAPIPANGDIRSARAHVHQGQVQEPQFSGDEHVDGGDGLEREALNLQTAHIHSRVKPLDYAVGQEGGD